MATQTLRSPGCHVVWGGFCLGLEHCRHGVMSVVGCLQAGQYTSVFVDNGSGVALTIQSGSSFSGLLLGA